MAILDLLELGVRVGKAGLDLWDYWQKANASIKPDGTVDPAAYVALVQDCDALIAALHKDRDEAQKQ